METFLHAFDLTNKLKCANFASRGTIDSLFVLDLIMEDPRPNPRRIPLELLRRCTPEMISGYASARMGLLYQATIFRQRRTKLTAQEQTVVSRADVEVEFERVRRIVNPDAPSRLSSLFFVEDNEDGRITLGNMFRNLMTDPMTIEVFILNYMALVRADNRWFERYFVDPNERYIENYWQQVPAGNRPSWEYLLEGSLSIVSRDDHEHILSHTKQTWPDLSLFTERQNEL